MKNLKMVSVIGHFGNGKNLLNGQTVKTKIVTDELCKQLGNENVLKIDTHGGKITLLKAPFQAVKALKKCRNVVILPAHNGLRVYAPLLTFFRRFFKKRKLHYVVIGGWLPEFLQKRKRLAKKLKHFDRIYVETNTMKNALKKQGFTNIFVMPNCKNLQILTPEDLVYPNGESYKLCTFSRVMKEKGIETAVKAVKQANEEFGRTVYMLDIYGQVDQNQTQWFEDLKKTFPEYIKYCGVVDYDKSVEVLKNYFALLFPTHFYTEGIPGTIIDAYAAGIPVIASKWESFSDIINDDTGIGYDFDSENALAEILLQVANTPEILLNEKPQCLTEAERYRTENVVKVLIKQLTGDDI